MNRICASLIAACSALLLGACSALPSGNFSRPAQAKSSLKRATNPQADLATVEQVVEANSDFAFDLYHQLQSNPGNLFISPYSISTALTMAYAGAAGETAEGMAAALHYDSLEELVHPALNHLAQSLNQERDPDSGDFELHTANSLWGQDGYPFRQEFLDTLGVHYGAGMRLVDFTQDRNREAARQAINDWVAEETEEIITDLIPPEMLDPLTRLVLANAIYFKGEWVQPFIARLSPLGFNRLDGSQVEAPAMELISEFRYTAADQFEAVQLPYKGDRIAMLLLLPKRGDFAAVENLLSASLLQEVQSNLSPTRYQLVLPKFAYTYEVRLKGALAELNMASAFDPDQADFSKMAASGPEFENLFIDEVIHKADVTVDEQGTEAAAATAVIIRTLSAPAVPALVFDRPFFFVISDTETGAILFLGRVLDPAAGNN